MAPSKQMLLYPLNEDFSRITFNNFLLLIGIDRIIWGHSTWEGHQHDILPNRGPGFGKVHSPLSSTRSSQPSGHMLLNFITWMVTGAPDMAQSLALWNKSSTWVGTSASNVATHTHTFIIQKVPSLKKKWNLYSWWYFVLWKLQGFPLCPHRRALGDLVWNET